MRIVIIGAVAAGTSAAAKARRNDEDAEIIMFDKDYDISYSACGMPYYIGEEISEKKSLTPRDTEFFRKKYNVNIFIKHEVTSINSESKSITVRNLEDKNVFEEHYDKLIIATGARPFIPNIEGIDKENVFSLRNIAQAERIKNYIEVNKPKDAVVVGTGFIGMEMAENLKSLGIKVTLVEKLNQAVPTFDSDMAAYVEDYVRSNDIELILNDSVISFKGEKRVNEVMLKSRRGIKTDMVIMAAGVVPNSELAIKAGIEVGSSKAIKVNTKMETNIKDIYACGDCAESFLLITNRSIYRPLGSTANKTGRIAGDQVTGGNLEHRGILGTSIFKIFDMAAAQTGLNEREALNQGYEVSVCHNIKPDKPEYYHGKEMVIKALADKETGKLLGVQIVGYTGVDKRIDVFAAAITFGAKAEDLFHLDLAYAPPFSTTKDPVIYTGMILDNELNRNRELITPDDLKKLIQSDEKVTVIDTRVHEQYKKDHIESAVNIPHEQIRGRIEELDSESIVVTYCNKGTTGNAVQNILINNGFKRVFNLSGGNKNYKLRHK